MTYWKHLRARTVINFHSAALSVLKRDCASISLQHHKEDALIVQTSYGPARGVRTARGGTVWKGLPFAAPPVGELRFVKPQPLLPWDGVLDCFQFRPRPMQPSSTYDVWNVNLEPCSEDCLFLNVWRPKGVVASGSKKLPVLFWIHGGALIGGSGADDWCNGDSFAHQGPMVVVTVNYRLGVFGFLATVGGDFNCGYWDQVAALRWVQREIVAFGGDPDRVTVAGQSAGGASILALIASDKTNRLFHQAIIMSGLGHWSFPPAAALKMGAEFARRSGAASTAARELRRLPAAEFQKMYETTPLPVTVNRTVGCAEQMNTRPPENMRSLVPTTDPDGLTYQPGWTYLLPPLPVTDGDLIEAPVMDLLKQGRGKHIAILIGANREELGFLENPDLPGCSAEWTLGGKVRHYDDVVQRCVREMCGLGIDGEPLMQMARDLVASYAAFLGIKEDDAQPACQNLWNLLASDLCYNATAVMVAQCRRQCGRETYVYRYDGINGQSTYHAWELSPTFNHTRGVGLGARGYPTVVEDLSEDERMVRISTAMHTAWAAFVTSGNPNTAALRAEWRPYGTQPGQDHFMILGDTCRAATYSVDRPCIQRAAQTLEVLYKMEPLGFTISPAAKP